MRQGLSKYTAICGPHCDGRVLHAPGECTVCDKFPELQHVRSVWWGINFTGHNDPDKLTCPAELARSLETINRWYGNVPQKD